MTVLSLVVFVSFLPLFHGKLENTTATCRKPGTAYVYVNLSVFSPSYLKQHFSNCCSVLIELSNTYIGALQVVMNGVSLPEINTDCSPP